MITKPVLRSLLAQIAIIGGCALVWILIGVFTIPHLPIADKRSFAWLLREQIAIDHERQGSESFPEAKKSILFLGSSVVERGVNDQYLDTLLQANGLPYFTTNAGAGGSFANLNLVSFRAMLEKGICPDRVIYGTFLQEFNGKFLMHMTLQESDTADLKIKDKSLYNAIRFGAQSLSPLLDAPNFHIYIFSINDAFRRIEHPNFFQQLSFGVNMFPRDSNFEYNPAYLEDLKTLYELCKSRNIPFAIFNTPVRPKIESYADVPYMHKQEAYEQIQRFADKENIPLWNFDNRKFDNDEFLDTYHVNAKGARKLARLLAEKITIWNKGIIEEDIVSPSADSIRREVKDSLVRTVFHF